MMNMAMFRGLLTRMNFTNAHINVVIEEGINSTKDSLTLTHSNVRSSSGRQGYPCTLYVAMAIPNSAALGRKMT
jgi:hypothetical protein